MPGSASFQSVKEIVVGGAGFGGVTLQSVGTGEAQMRQSAERAIRYDGAMFEKFLKFLGR
jgi:hypothetical protein